MGIVIGNKRIQNITFFKDYKIYDGFQARSPKKLIDLESGVGATEAIVIKE